MMNSIFDAISHGIDLRLAEVDALPQGVQLWMTFMRYLFMSSVIFIYWKKQARAVFVMALSTAVLLFGFKSMFPETHSGDIGRIIHLVLWTAVLVYMISQRNQIIDEIRSKVVFSKVYGIWAVVVILVLTTSTLLDVASYVR